MSKKKAEAVVPGITWQTDGGDVHDIPEENVTVTIYTDYGVYKMRVILDEYGKWKMSSTYSPE